MIRTMALAVTTLTTLVSVPGSAQQEDRSELLGTVETALAKLRAHLTDLVAGRAGRLHAFYTERPRPGMDAGLDAAIARVFLSDGLWFGRSDRSRVCVDLVTRGIPCEGSASPSLIGLSNVTRRANSADVTFRVEWFEPGTGWKRQHLRLSFYRDESGRLAPDSLGFTVRY